jgi:hypothetical protein
MSSDVHGFAMGSGVHLLDMGPVAHGPGWPWAGLRMFWLLHSLDRELAGLGVGCHVLLWAGLGRS